MLNYPTSEEQCGWLDDRERLAPGDPVREQAEREPEQYCNTLGGRYLWNAWE
jgi:hypothetical protein